jgi:hypothetical protein
MHNACYQFIDVQMYVVFVTLQHRRKPRNSNLKFIYIFVHLKRAIQRLYHSAPQNVKIQLNLKFKRFDYPIPQQSKTLQLNQHI